MPEVWDVIVVKAVAMEEGDVTSSSTRVMLVMEDREDIVESLRDVAKIWTLGWAENAIARPEPMELFEQPVMRAYFILTRKRSDAAK